MPPWNMSVCFLFIRVSEDLWSAAKLFNCFICLKEKKGQGKVRHFSEAGLVMKTYFRRVKYPLVLLPCCIVIISQRTFLIHSWSVSLRINLGSNAGAGQKWSAQSLGLLVKLWARSGLAAFGKGILSTRLAGFLKAWLWVEEYMARLPVTSSSQGINRECIAWGGKDGEEAQGGETAGLKCRSENERDVTVLLEQQMMRVQTGLQAAWLYRCRAPWIASFSFSLACLAIQEGVHCSKISHQRGVCLRALVWHDWNAFCNESMISMLKLQRWTLPTADVVLPKLRKMNC